MSAIRGLLTEAEKTPDRDASVLLIGTAIMVVGFAVRNFFDYMFAGSLAVLFWILIAIGLGEWRGVQERKRSPA